jgi:hypothetical protein
MTGATKKEEGELDPQIDDQKYIGPNDINFSLKDGWNKLTENEKLILGREARKEDKPNTFKTEDGTTVYLEDFKKISPAQDFHDGIAYITQSLWYDKPNFDSKGKFLGTVKKQGIIVITSDKKAIRIDESRNQYGNLLMDVPDTAPENRFSSRMIQKFLNDDIDFFPYEPFVQLRGKYQEYLDLGNIPGAYSVNALYDFLSYCTWLFETVPYLWYTGDLNAGKTKACTIHEQVGFNGFMAVGMTAPNLFRIIRDTRGMLIIDESENQGNVNNGSDEDQIAREQAINSGYKKSGKTSRIERDGGKPVRVQYPTFSTKVIGGIKSVSDTIRSRSFRFLMLRTNNQDIANSVVSEKDPIWQEIRDKLYITMLNHWTEIQDQIKKRSVSNRHKFEDGTELVLIGRDWEKAEPILIMAQWASGYGNDNGALIEEVWNFLKFQRETEEEGTLDTLDTTMINVVDEIFNKEGSPIELKRVSNLIAIDEGIDTESRKFNLSKYSRMIRTHLERVGIARNFKNRSKNRLYFDTSAELIEATKKRYKINVTNVTNPTNLDNLDNLINLANQFLDRFTDKGDKSVEEVNEGLTREVNEKLALLQDKLARLTRLTTWEPTPPNNQTATKEDLAFRLKEYLESHEGIETLSKVYSLGKEWYPGIKVSEFQELIDLLKKDHELNFNYAAQNVSLLIGGKTE